MVDVPPGERTFTSSTPLDGITMSTCVECGKTLTGRQVRFCCKSHRTRARDRRQYHKYKSEGRSWHQKYIKKLRERTRQWRGTAFERGLCLHCGRENDNFEGGLKVCSLCRGKVAH